MIYGLYHSAGETVGLLGDVLHQHNLPFHDLHLHEGDGLPRDTSDLEGLIVMGGPMNVDEVHKYPFLRDEVRLIEKMISENKPVLGICLGAQLIAKALGSKVYPNKHKEVGWHPIQLTREGKIDSHMKHFPAETTVLHWHGDTFDLPKDTTHLARSKKCENQAFRYGDNVYGLQFHLEVTPGMVKSWCGSSDGKKDLAGANMRDVDVINASSAAHAKLKPLAEKFFTSYLRNSFGQSSVGNLLSV